MIELANSMSPPYFGISSIRWYNGHMENKNHPRDREWLYQEYIVNDRSTKDIGAEVELTSRTIGYWLRKHGIKGKANRDEQGRFIKGVHSSPGTEFKKGEIHNGRKPQPYWGYGWLYEEYVTNQRSAEAISEEVGCTSGAIYFWLLKHSIKTRTTQEVRAIKHWGSLGEANGMYGKMGELSGNWKGGLTPELKALYVSPEWRNEVRPSIWERDKSTCQECGLMVGLEIGRPGHVHHIDGIILSLRMVPSNLILLCRDCHHWVHSRRNTEKKWLA